MTTSDSVQDVVKTSPRRAAAGRRSSTLTNVRVSFQRYQRDFGLGEFVVRRVDGALARPRAPTAPASSRSSSGGVVSLASAAGRSRSGPPSVVFRESSSGCRDCVGDPAASELVRVSRVRRIPSRCAGASLSACAEAPAWSSAVLRPSAPLRRPGARASLRLEPRLLHARGLPRGGPHQAIPSRRGARVDAPVPMSARFAYDVFCRAAHAQTAAPSDFLPAANAIPACHHCCGSRRDLLQPMG